MPRRRSDETLHLTQRSEVPMIPASGRPAGWKKRLGARSLAILGAVALGITTSPVDARPSAMPSAEVVEMGYDELIGEFVNAHARAGFTLEKRHRTRGATTLTFDYQPAGRPYGKRGVAQFVIRNEGSTACPCWIYNVLAGPISGVAHQDPAFEREIASHLNAARIRLVEHLKRRYRALEGDYPPEQEPVPLTPVD